MIFPKGEADLCRPVEGHCFKLTTWKVGRSGKYAQQFSGLHYILGYPNPVRCCRGVGQIGSIIPVCCLPNPFDGS